jgi:tRNA (guanine-N7-)-methyltransferase
MNTPNSQRPLKSFVRREGRLTQGQRQALESHSEKYILSAENAALDFTKAFDRLADTILEIGFGMGHSLVAMADALPATNFLGLEVYRPGVGSLLIQIKAKAITNVRVICADAQTTIPICIPEASLAGIHIFFPDPWPKNRHQKRRLVQLPFVNLLTEKLKPGGYLHLATDWEDYALQMLQVCSAVPALKNSAGEGQFAINQGLRPATKYEQRGERLGHRVRDLVFYKGSPGMGEGASPESSATNRNKSAANCVFGRNENSCSPPCHSTKTAF